MPIQPGLKKVPYEIELTDAKSHRGYGLKIVPGSLQIGTISTDDTVYVRSTGKRVGDFDEQRNWKLGRGSENFSDNADAFWDSQNLWTLTEGHAHQALQWYHARGLKSEDMYMPTRDAGSMQFQPLLEGTLYISNSFSASASYSADKGYVWLRRVGNPGTLTFRLMSDSSGDPGSALQTVTKTISDITDTVSAYELFNWTGTESLTGSTTYHVSVHGSSGDDSDNHWEVGVDPDAAAGEISGDGSSWSSPDFALYFRVAAGDFARRWFAFYLSEAWYIVDRKDNGSTASVLYINGDRGTASSATSTTLTHSGKSWTADRWIGAWVKIISGTGAGQAQAITDNTTNTLTVAEWENGTTPDSTSQYVIYATEWFTQITPSGASLSVVSSQPVVVNNIAYIPQGTSVFLHMRWSGTAHDAFAETATGTKGLADFFVAVNDKALAGPVLWRANNNGNTGSGGNVTVSYANLRDSNGAFLAYNTALTWNTAIFTGSASFKITGLGRKEDQVYVFREDGLGFISNNQYVNIETGIEKTPHRANGVMNLNHGQFLYYSWINSVVRVFGSTHDDIGDDYRGIGLPNGREGVYEDGDTYLKLIFFAINAGVGWSSVMAWDGLGWHEVLRGRRAGAGERIRMVKVQTCDGTRNRLWAGLNGGDLIFQELPYLRASPRLDTGARFMHEAVLESSSIDMGTASELPKFISRLSAIIRNLNTNGREVFVDFQTDDDVHTTTWTPGGKWTRSPESKVTLNLENITRFAYRLRICSNDNSVPIDIEGVIPSGYARTPYKMIFTLQIQSGGVYSRQGDTATFGELTRWLLDESREAGSVRMDSVFELAHGWRVVIHPPRTFPMVAQRGRNPEEGSHTLSLMEV